MLIPSLISQQRWNFSLHLFVLDCPIIRWWPSGSLGWTWARPGLFSVTSNSSKHCHGCWVGDWGDYQSSEHEWGGEGYWGLRRASELIMVTAEKETLTVLSIFWSFWSPVSEEHIDQCILHLGVLALLFLRTSSDRGQEQPGLDNLIWSPFMRPFQPGSAEHDRTFAS